MSIKKNLVAAAILASVVSGAAFAAKDDTAEAKLKWEYNFSGISYDGNMIITDINDKIVGKELIFHLGGVDTTTLEIDKAQGVDAVLKAQNFTSETGEYTEGDPLTLVGGAKWTIDSAEYFAISGGAAVSIAQLPELEFTFNGDAGTNNVYPASTDDQGSFAQVGIRVGTNESFDSQEALVDVSGVYVTMTVTAEQTL